MLYKTHKVGGSVAMMVGFSYLQGKGLLVENINPLFQLAVMYPYASWGATAPDLDHHDTSIKEQTPFNLFINKILKLFGINHRGITHSVKHVLIPSLLLLVLADVILAKLSLEISFEMVFLRLMTFGALLGVVSHLLLDSLTYSGLPVDPLLSDKKKIKKFRLVPRKSFFSVGGVWEKSICRFLYIILGVLLINILLNYYMGYSVFDLVKILINTILEVKRG
jgi:membrane-bound metal-dependent hydrolase YbcI (DUF457 family)